MLTAAPIRRCFAFGIALACVCAVSTGAAAQVRGHGAPPTAHGGGYGMHSQDASKRMSVGRRPGQEHLAEWMNRHSNLSPADQQRALEREPGFHDLAPNVQQRMRDRLNQLDTMPPAQRDRVLARTEAMERLAPEQRQQIRSSMQQLSSLPPDQRRVVARAFRQYRRLPPAQRQAAIASGQFSNSLSPEGRSTFNQLLSVEPYLPAPPAGQGAMPEQP